jgi:hypothetical protein
MLLYNQWDHAKYIYVVTYDIIAFHFIYSVHIVILYKQWDNIRNISICCDIRYWSNFLVFHVKIIIFSTSHIFHEMCSKPEILLAFHSKWNYSMIIISTKLFAIFENMSGYWETKRNKNYEHQWSYTSATWMKPLVIDFSNKCKISNVIFSLAYPPKSFYFRFISLIMNPSNFLSESADWETSKFEIYILTNLSFEREIRDIRKILVLNKKKNINSFKKR